MPSFDTICRKVDHHCGVDVSAGGVGCAEDGVKYYTGPEGPFLNTHPSTASTEVNHVQICGWGLDLACLVATLFGIVQRWAIPLRTLFWNENEQFRIGE